MCRVISSAWCWARKSAPPSARRNFKFCAETQRRMTTIATTKDAMAQAKTRMEKAVEDFRKELAALRTGRASVALLDHIRVDYHGTPDRKSTRLNSSHLGISYAVFCLKKKKNT